MEDTVRTSVVEETSGIDIAELGDRYREKGYFRRLRDMFAGLGRPRGTAEYKLARIELQRQAAPLVAVAAVGLLVVVMAVVTMMPNAKDATVEVFVAPEELSEPQPNVEEPPEPPPPDPTPLVDPDISVDVPTPCPVVEDPAPPQPTQQVSVKPASQDTVANVDCPIRMKDVFSSRDPGSIGAKTGGGDMNGDPTTEIAVMKVLWWLKAHQNSDGSWNGGNKLANTGLAILTYLAHGEYPGNRKSPYTKDFGPVVQLALDYIMDAVDQGGQTVRMRGADGNEYAFLIATYALCEAYGMTRNPNCKQAAYVCLERIVRGQSPTGGWDYKLNPHSSRDDMSFAGWALQALKAGKLAGIHPEGLDECIKKAVRCMQTRNFKNGGFNYTAGGNPTGLTATGCLAMQLLGYGGKKEVLSALDFMREWMPAFDKADFAPRNVGSSPQYYCYYATQCKYQAGMKPGATRADEAAWRKWNAAMKSLYSKSIIDEAEKVKDWSGQEHKQGHYENTDAHSSRPVMDTCLVALQLMVYYRYLPTSQVAVAADAHVSAAEAAVGEGDVEVVVDNI